MIVDLMHACDVAEALAADPPASAADWAWAKQLRFYSDSAQGGKVRNSWPNTGIATALQHTANMGLRAQVLVHHYRRRPQPLEMPVGCALTSSTRVPSRPPPLA